MQNSTEASFSRPSTIQDAKLSDSTQCRSLESRLVCSGFLVPVFAIESFQLGLRATFELHSHDSDTGTGTVRTGYVWINESHHAWTPGFIQLEAEGLIK